MGRHRTSEAPHHQVLGWGLFATVMACTALTWRGSAWSATLGLGCLGATLTVTLWVVDLRARRPLVVDPDAAGPRLRDQGDPC